MCLCVDICIYNIAGYTVLTKITPTQDIVKKFNINMTAYFYSVLVIDLKYTCL